MRGFSTTLWLTVLSYQPTVPSNSPNSFTEIKKYFFKKFLRCSLNTVSSEATQIGYMATGKTLDCNALLRSAGPHSGAYCLCPKRLPLTWAYVCSSMIECLLSKRYWTSYCLTLKCFSVAQWRTPPLLSGGPWQSKLGRLLKDRAAPSTQTHCSRQAPLQMVTSQKYLVCGENCGLQSIFEASQRSRRSRSSVVWAVCNRHLFQFHKKANLTR